jgi:hypothetical protein
MDPFVAVGDYVINTRRIDYVHTLAHEPVTRISIHFAPSDPIELEGDAAHAFLDVMFGKARRSKVKRDLSGGGRAEPTGEDAGLTKDLDDDQAGA